MAQVFKRYELKYLFTSKQVNDFLNVLNNYTKPDIYHKSSIRNIYYDTPTFLLIRKSIEKPEYKEKLRVRTYQTIDNDQEVFVELKKKYKSVVYKRRVTLPYSKAISFLNKEDIDESSQVINEIKYVLDFYDDLHPMIFLSYERESYVGLEDSNFRITFDKNIIWRDYDVDLTKDIYGENILNDDLVLVEIKTNTGYPKWLVDFLSENKIYKTSFSKYGNVYSKIVNNKGERKYA